MPWYCTTHDKPVYDLVCPLCYKQEITALKERIKLLESENAELESENAELELENNKLKRRVEALGRENSQLKSLAPTPPQAFFKED